MTPTMVSHAVMLEHHGGFTTLTVANLMVEGLKGTQPKLLSTTTLQMTFFKVIASSVELSGRSPPPRTSSTSCGLSSSPSTRLTSC